MTNPTPSAFPKSGEPPVSELDDAIDLRQQIRDELYDPQRDAFDLIVEAARRVANPDIEAAADVVERIGLPIGAYAGHRRVARNIAQRIFQAALGITTKEDEVSIRSVATRLW